MDPSIRAWGRLQSEAIREERLRADVERLLGPHNRLHSLEEMKRVEGLLFDAFAGTGWETHRRPFQLDNVLGSQDHGWGLPTTFPRLDGTNLLAVKRGEVEPAEAVVVAAHYDTRPDTPGADDNTASVACLLELARTLSTARFRRTVILVATDLEEVGSVGARILARDLTREYRVRGVLVLETMAFVDPRPHTFKLESKPGLLYRHQWMRMQRHEWASTFTLVLYRQRAAGLAATVAAGLELLVGPDAAVLARDPGELPLLGFFLRRLAPGLVRNFHRSDHVPFWDAGVPAVQVTDGANFGNPHYHEPTDLPATLDFRRLASIAGAVAVTLAVYAGLIPPADSTGAVAPNR